MGDPFDETVAFEALQGLREHLLADPADLAPQLAEPQGAFLEQQPQHQHCPPARDVLQDTSTRAVRLEDVDRKAVYLDTYLHAITAPSSMYFPGVSVQSTVEPMIVITGASGHLGRGVIKKLLADGVPADEIVATARRPESVSDLGVEVRLADYTRPETVSAALAGADRVLLVSSSGPLGQRVPQHRAVIDAAKASGTVARLVYTGVLGGERANFTLADDHRGTELALAESGLEYAVLRNGWYTENYTEQLAPALANGAIVGSAGPDARVASATRAEYAEAAAVVLRTDGSIQTFYELSGDTAWSFAELADEVSRRSGTSVVYRQVSPEEHRAILVGAGLPADVAAILQNVDEAVDRGELAFRDGTLNRLLGRPTAPWTDAVAAALTTQASPA